MAQDLRQRTERVIKEANLLAEKQIHSRQVEQYLKDLWYLEAEVSQSSFDDAQDLSSEIEDVSIKLRKIKEKSLQDVHVSLAAASQAPKESDEKKATSFSPSPANAAPVQVIPANPAPKLEVVQKQQPAPSTLTADQKEEKAAEVRRFIQSREAATQSQAEALRKAEQPADAPKPAERKPNAVNADRADEVQKNAAMLEEERQVAEAIRRSLESQPPREEKSVFMTAGTSVDHDRRAAQEEQDLAEAIRRSLIEDQIAKDEALARELQAQENAAAAQSVVAEEKAAPVAVSALARQRIDDISDEALFGGVLADLHTVVLAGSAEVESPDEYTIVLTVEEQAQQQDNMRALMQDLMQSIERDFMLQELLEIIHDIKNDPAVQSNLFAASQILDEGLRRIEVAVDRQLGQQEVVADAPDSVGANPRNFFNTNNAIIARRAAELDDPDAPAPLASSASSAPGVV